MDLSSTLIVVVLAILMEAFFSGSEFALISVNRPKLQHLAEKGNRSAQAVLDLLKTPETLFTTTSLGTNLAVVISTAVFTAYMVGHFGTKGDFFAVIIISPFILFGGEIIPKMIVQSRADSATLLIVYPLRFFHKIFSPLIPVFTFLTNFFLRGFGGKEQIAKTLSREHIRQITRLDAQASSLEISEKRMLHKIFNFGETTVEQCMVPLAQIINIKDTANMAEAHAIANESGFSRLPVYHERIFNLIGILNTFDLLNVPSDTTPITGVIRPAYYVPPNKKIDDLLKELQQSGLHMAIVVDEYGGCIGIVTMEDLLEEIFGEIEDEYDEPEKLYESYADGGFLIGADKEIDLINDRLDTHLPKGDYDTLGGLVIDRLEKIPSPGDQVVENGVRLTVKDASKKKINSIILRKIDKENTSLEVNGEKPD